VTGLPDRLAAALADRYRIERELGAGGMATVYLAQDLKHDRKVALKVLKPELAAVLGAERFVVEIKTTAALQHPHILPLFDSGEADGFLYYVMPFIDGETLRSKLDRETQLGIEESVRIASDVASALHYAHEHGVIHRDIKPENILLHDGRPMVADFGIALALSAAAGGRMTETGLSLGTPHYMSPEQATAEKEISARSDVYSLGSVLYEMLTGEPPHMGNSAQQIIMKIITEEAAPVTRLRKAVPLNVAAAVARSLEKLPADRFASARAFSEALANPGFTTMQGASGQRVAAAGGSRRTVLGLGAALAVMTLVTGWVMTRPVPPPVVTAATLSVELRTPLDVPLNEVGNPIALAPDGSFLVFVGPDPDSTHLTALWRRDLDQLDAVVIPGTRGAHSPAVAFDANSVSFVRRNEVAGSSGWEASFDGGLPKRRPTGRAWQLTGDQVLVGGAMPIIQKGTVDALTDSLLAVPGGRPIWTRATASPDRRVIAFQSSRNEDDSIWIRPPDGEGRAPLGEGSSPVFLGNDLLAFLTRDQTLQVGRLNPDRTGFIAPPDPLVPSVASSGSGNGVFAVGSDGTLVYAPGATAGRTRPVWVAAGRVEPVPMAEWQVYGGVALSLDASRAAFVIGNLSRGGEIWVKDLRSGTTSPLVTNAVAARPAWTRDGTTLAYLVEARRAAPGSLGEYRVESRGVDRSAPAQVRGAPYASFNMGELAISPDDQFIAVRRVLEGQRIGRDIFSRAFDADSLIPFAAEAAHERGPRFSPDGRWLLYASDRTGRDEIYVEAFPNGGRRVQVSLDGGREPTWSRDGSQIFYRALDGWMTAVRLRTGNEIVPVGRERLFDASGFLANQFLTMYDVAPDGRFLMLQLDPRPERTDLVIIRNWVQQVKARLGGRK
jgi:eukaryotic-like serine/threonine-protein kinase